MVYKPRPVGSKSRHDRSFVAIASSSKILSGLNPRRVGSLDHISESRVGFTGSQMSPHGLFLIGEVLEGGLCEDSSAMDLCGVDVGYGSTRFGVEPDEACAHM